VDTSRRCDHCGAQAYWTTWIDLTELHWCNHFYEYEAGEKLRAEADIIIDHTDELAEILSRRTTGGT